MEMTCTELLEAMSRPTLIVVPHMDDEVLACGGAVALVERKGNILFAFVTVGDSVPSGQKDGEDPALLQRLPQIRADESRAALHGLGIEERQLRFFELPDGQVSSRRAEVGHLLAGLIEAHQPQCVLVPFRYDQHPDHIALNRITREVLRASSSAPLLIEYFVYHDYPLLPGRDIRTYCRGDRLVRVDLSRVADKKRAALECFTSQTTVFHRRQCRPVLGKELIETFSKGPEQFLVAGVDTADAELLTIPPFVVGMAQYLQPRLKRLKERLRLLLHRAARR